MTEFHPFTTCSAAGKLVRKRVRQAQARVEIGNRPGEQQGPAVIPVVLGFYDSYPMCVTNLPTSAVKPSPTGITAVKYAC